jgi:hypothetical protein
MSDEAYSTLTTIVKLLKTIYGVGITNQFADEKVTWNLLTKSDRKPKGLGYVFGMRYERNQSVGARAESSKLPDPMTGKKDQGKITPVYMYGTLRLTGPMIAAAAGQEAAFVDGLADELDDIYQSLVNDMNRQCHMDGFGKLGVLSAAMTPSTSATFKGTFDNDLGVRYFKEGMLVDIFDSTGATPSTTCVGQRVSIVNPATKEVTFEKSAQTWLANHPNATIAAYTNDATEIAAASIVVKMGTRDAAWTSADTPLEFTGLEGIFDDGTNLATFENITVASYPKWKANILSNSGVGRDLSIDLMLQACDLTRMNSGKEANQILMGLGQRRKYANLLIGDVRFQPGQLKGGYETLTFSGGDGSVDMVIDPMCQPGKIRFFPKGVIQKYELTSLGWGDLDGNRLHRRSSYDEYEAFLRLYGNLGCEQRNCLTSLNDLVEPSIY